MLERVCVFASFCSMAKGNGSFRWMVNKSGNFDLKLKFVFYRKAQNFFSFFLLKHKNGHYQQEETGQEKNHPKQEAAFHAGIVEHLTV